MTPPPRVRLGVSACLLGERVRYDGGHKRDAFLTDVLGPHVDWVPVCPEVELGLGVPRATLRLEGRVSAPRLVQPASGEDLGARMRGYARRRVRALGRLQLDGYVLKRGSPSCGLLGVPVHRARGAPRAGRGLFAAALTARLPGLPVEEEGRLADPALRARFLDRVFARARRRLSRAVRVTERGIP
jgi:uncharacterized protein YbbK (DUF523 family)